MVAIGFVASRLLRQRQDQDSAAYETVAARRDTILATVNASGSVVPRESVTLDFSIAGLLVETSVKVRQKVEAGQPLARLDACSLAWSVKQAEAALRTSEIGLAQFKEGADAADIAAAEEASTP